MASRQTPKPVGRPSIAPSIFPFLKLYPQLHLGELDGFTQSGSTISQSLDSTPFRTTSKPRLAQWNSAGGNMTEAVAVRRRDEGRKNMAGQLLLSPESRVLFDTPAAKENNTGPLSREAYPPSHMYISSGKQSVDFLKGEPEVVLFTCGFDPLRDAGVEYGSKLHEADVAVRWHNYPDLTHGFLQMAPVSEKDDCLRRRRT
ncbi:uncharacterized protein PV07_01349 [Cladophialophora immunda]|uniref:Alpha/beta hydrolase fold-3 domain-containing protein n=1 Tax=Cladophialophora immunda TaxID=569365 RepID=A0A0D2CTU3_9EURO|nr:uncharacterized protein PV07_01349 [Cladophialophora immunda]KIW34573.1 hypothetical protein PV07_01349 [Cladophialophora immunda]